MTADRRDLLIPAIRSVRVADGCIHLDREEAWVVATALLPVIDRLCAEAAAEALREAADALETQAASARTEVEQLARSGRFAAMYELRDRAQAIHPTREDQQ